MGVEASAESAAVAWNKEVVLRALRAADRGDLDGLRACFAGDYVDRSHHGSRPGADREAAMTAFREIAKAFPDTEHQVHTLIGEGDLVALRVSATGTHSGPFHGVAPTGRRLSLTETVIYRVREGVITERWRDGTSSLMSELGAAEPKPETTSPAGPSTRTAPVVRRAGDPVATNLAGTAFWELALDHVSLTWFELEPGVRFERHAHDSEQITFVLDGQLVFEVDGGSHVVGRGEAIAIPAGVPHAVQVGVYPCRAIDAWSPPPTHLRTP